MSAEAEREQPVGEPALSGPVRQEPVHPEPMHQEPVLPGSLLPERGSGDTDAAWGDHPDRSDDRLYRDRPPHWADY